jgi:3-oxoacyl-[acyl-carrier-protein] synthase-1
VSAGVDPSLLRNSLAVTDLNGELGRSMRWGTALTMLEGELRHLQLVCPAESFGEIGAASGPASVCVAAGAFARGYSPSSHTFVVSMDDCGTSGAILVQRP